MKKSPLHCVFILVALFTFFECAAQPGVDGAANITAAGTVVNAYTPLLTTATAGSATLSANIASLDDGTPLTAGSLVMIISMQGATINTTNTSSYGQITSYNGAGTYEFAYVSCISAPSTIFLQSPLVNSYTVGGTNRVQVVRVPQYTTLTVNTGASLTGQAWNGATGGIVVADVTGAATVNGLIIADTIGFRGGALMNGTAIEGTTDFVNSSFNAGAEKGEGIAGFETDYDAMGGRYCRGAPANGGGGGEGHNSAGGGGANGNNGVAYNGLGNPDLSGGANWITAWNLEAANFANNVSSGGGRGGYSCALSANNPITTAPGNAAWTCDSRRNVGAWGGEPLTINAENTIFLGGGGGAGNEDNFNSTAGGRGGGIIYVVASSVAGTGIISANGQSAAVAGLDSSNYNDAPGGGGGGGTIIIKSAVASNLTLNATGGPGGNLYNSPTAPGPEESEGAGGGGGGGYIAINSGTPVMSVAGGPNGTINSPGNQGFPPNGGTIGGSGQTATVSTNFIAYNAYADSVSLNLCTGMTYALPNGQVISAPGTYSDTLINQHGCDSIIKVSVVYSNVQATGTTSVCSGQSAQLNATSAFIYSWSPATGLSSTTISNPVATPASTTTYTVTGSEQLGNLVINGDFSQGNFGFTSGYNYVTQNTTQIQYSVAPNPHAWNAGEASCGDHTTGTGNMMLVDGSTTAGLNIWCETVSVLPNTNYAFSAWVTCTDSVNPPHLQFSIDGGVIGTPFAPLGTPCLWQQFYAIWNSGTNTTADICVLDQNTIAAGNDFAMDDISFSGICQTTDSVTVTVNPIYHDTINASICAGSTYTLPNGNTTTTTGTYIDTLQTMHGCDSIITVNLAVYPVYADTISANLCTGMTYTLPNGHVISSAGTYSDTLTSSHGCDSTITAIVTYSSVHATGTAAICKGDSTALSATGTLYYSWTPTTGLNNPDTANPIASPVVTTTYVVSGYEPVGNLIVNGDFTQGNTGFSSDYIYTPPPNTHEGQYWVGTDAQTWNGGMAPCGDHTTGTGNMMFVNGATVANTSIWCETVNVLPNTNYAFTAWVATLTASSPAQLQFSINGAYIGTQFTATVATCVWQPFYAIWNSGSNTNATICVVDRNINAGGNDFAIDDIAFSPLCIVTDSVTVTVNPTYTDTINPAICAGNTYTLPNGNTTTTTGTYIDTLQTIHGCDSIITVNLTVHPVYSDTADPIICPFDIYTLPDGTVVHTQGTYITHFTSIYGCDSNTITNLTVIPNTLIAGDDTAICLGDSAQLFASGSLLNNYSWSPAAGLSDSSIANPKASPAQTTTYVVTSQIGSGNLVFNGDFSQQNQGFTSDYNYNPNLVPEGNYYVGPNPHNYHPGFANCPGGPNGTTNMMICNGASTANTNVWCQTISVTPNTNYTFIAWGESVSVGNPAQLQFSIDGGQIGPVFNLPLNTCQWTQFYTTWNSGANTTASICILDQQTAAGGNDFAIDDISFVSLCTAYDSVTVVVHNPDTIIIDTAICQGPAYTFPDGTTATASATDTARFSNRFGCDSTIITNLTVHPTYTDTIIDTICYGTSYTLPSGLAVRATGVYVDTLPTIFGCDSIIITYLTVTAPPVTIQNDTICSNGTFIRPSGLTTNTAGQYFDTLTTNTGCDSVVITNLTVNPTSATTVYDTICVGSSFTLGNGNVVTTAGTYPVTLPNRFGCDSVATTVLTVISVTVTATETDETCYGLKVGTVSATATGGVSPYNYNLLLAGNSVGNNATGSFSQLAAGSYEVSATDNFGCSGTTNITIHQPDSLVLKEAVTEVTCYGAHNGQIALTATGGTQPYIFILNDQSSSSGAYSGLDTGSYECGVVDNNGCSDSTSVSVTQPQPVYISISPDSLYVNLGKTIQLNATSNYDPSTTYLWSPSFGLSCINCPDPVVDINNTAQYYVQVTASINGNNCTADTGVTVTVIPDYDLFIPNVFTPNNDGKNDFFQVFGNLPAMRYMHVTVFDRIGELVFESEDVNFKWDGTFKGQPAPQGVYVYTLRAVFDDGHTDKLFTGSVTLLR